MFVSGRDHKHIDYESFFNSLIFQLNLTVLYEIALRLLYLKVHTLMQKKSI